MASSDGFSDILQKAEELRSTIDTDIELPRVERSLQQILDAGQKLWSKSQHAASEDAVNVKAAALLGPKGYGIPQISQKLEGLSSVKTYEALDPVKDTDVRGFLKNERDNALLAAIEASKKRTFAEAESRHWESMRDEWEREKQRLLNTLLGSQQDATIDFSLDHSAMMSGHGDMSMSRGSARSAMNATELAYAQQIYIYNDEVVAGGTVPPLLTKMIDVAKSLNDEHIKEIWNMVNAVSSTPSVASGSIAASKESKEVHQSIISNSKQYLEKSYLRHIQQTINKNLQSAMLGGAPGMIQLVKSYLNVALGQQNPGLEDGLVSDQPVWPMIYFCLRCGDLNAAVTIAEQAAPSIGDFSVHMREYATHKCLTQTALAKIKLQYRRQVRNSTDPFKRLVFCVVGCCDVVDAHSDVAEKIDDFLWLRLTQIQSSSGSLDDAEALRLPQLQTQLLEEFGEGHFQAQQRPFLYFQVLLLTGQFEAAIEFLSRHDRLQTHAVHIALVLYESNLLLLPDNIQTHLLSRDLADSSPLRRLNLARLIMMYTRKFEATDPREALQYFYFLRDIKGPTMDSSLFVSCVSELVLETREFDMLLGKMERNGRRKPGAIDKFQSDTKSIIETVAYDTEKKGMFEESVKLYDLAQSHDKALKLLSQLLSRHLPEPSVPGSAKDRISTLALDIAKRYKSKAGMSKQVSGTFYLLLDLVIFFEQYHSEDFDNALDIIKQLKILPTSLDSVEAKVDAFKYYEEEIRQALPDILVATMNILLNMYKKVRPMNSTGGKFNSSASLSFTVEDGGRNSMVLSIREHARSLITFAGMMPYRLPGDTSARLIQMEVLMN